MRLQSLFSRALFRALAAFGFLSCALASAQDSSPVGLIEADDEFPVQPPSRVQAGLFYLSLPESWDGETTARIEVPVVIIPASEPTGQPPVVMLTGGPGTEGLSAARFPGAYPWVGKRDFILLGQRGTHHARPALMCDAYSRALAARAGQVKEVEAIRNCRTSLEARGIDASAYNTANIAKDLDALRRAIGADRLSLYGLSYGTRIALAYARDFPARVESLLLDSPLPFSASYDRELPANVEFVLRSIAERCANDTACSAAYPDLWTRFSAALEVLQGAPATDHPGAARIAFHILPGSAADIADAPRLMDAVARNDLSEFPMPSETRSVSNFAWGMRLSVWCAERQSLEDIETTSFAGINSPTFPPYACDAWNVADRPLNELRDPSGAFPTLILAGEFDALTPPAWGERVLTRLGRARLITIPNGLHSVTTNWGGSGCAMSLAGEFFANEEAFLQDAGTPACIAGEIAPDFAVGG